jgi:hypothetical protein
MTARDIYLSPATMPAVRAALLHSTELGGDVVAYGPRLVGAVFGAGDDCIGVATSGDTFVGGGPDDVARAMRGWAADRVARANALEARRYAAHPHHAECCCGLRVECR